MILLPKQISRIIWVYRECEQCMQGWQMWYRTNIWASMCRPGTRCLYLSIWTESECLHTHVYGHLQGYPPFLLHLESFITWNSTVTEGRISAISFSDDPVFAEVEWFLDFNKIALWHLKIKLTCCEAGDNGSFAIHIILIWISCFLKYSIFSLNQGDKTHISRFLFSGLWTIFVEMGISDRSQY